MVTTDRTTRQLLLRVPQELHQRLAAQAAREGRSMNAIANDALRAMLAAADPISPASDEPTARRARLRARAAARGLLAPPQPIDGPRLPPRELATLWDELADASRGLGPMLDAELRADRDRR